MPRMTIAECENVHTLADQAAYRAAKAAVPQPVPIFDSRDPGHAPRFIAEEGLVGWVKVHLRPATSSYARWLKDKYGDSGSDACYSVGRHYQGGLSIYVRGNETGEEDFGQPVTRKEAAASAYARVLQQHGLLARVEVRLD